MTTRIDRLTQQRLEKLERLRSRGIDAYPRRYHRTHTTQQAVALFRQKEEGATSEDRVNVAGRITAHRSMGKIAFLDIRDGTGRIQLSLRRDELDDSISQLVKDLDLGDFIGASGRVYRTRTNEPTVEVESLTILAKSLQPLPEKWHGLVDIDLRYRQRYLDLISNPETRQLFEIRSRVIVAIRQFLSGRGFIEVETPVLQPSAGGALARPFVTHHHALDRDLFLRIALELHLKRLIIGGFDKVYELGRAFRNEGIDATHNPEFTLLESYEAYADYNDVMQMVEEMVFTVAQQVLGTDQVKFGEHIINLRPPWQRLNLSEAVIKYAGIDYDQFPDRDSLAARMLELKIEVDPKKDRGRLIDDLLSTFVEPNLVQPTFLVDYPIEMSPLAKTRPDNDRVVERFEGFAGGLEMANAFTELNDPLEQRRRFFQQQRERGADEEEEKIDEDFLLAMEYGMPPTGGLGVGIDRLVMLLTGQQSIREVILFPQLKEKP